MQKYPGMSYGADSRYKRVGPQSDFRNTKVRGGERSHMHSPLPLSHKLCFFADRLRRSRGQRQQ